MHCVLWLISLANSHGRSRCVLDEECSWDLSLYGKKSEESATYVWLFSKPLNLIEFIELHLIIGTWSGVLPSSILTTEDMDGLSVGDGLVHRRAKFSILCASSLEYFEPRLGSTSSRRFPCSCRT